MHHLRLVSDNSGCKTAAKVVRGHRAARHRFDLREGFPAAAKLAGFDPADGGGSAADQPPEGFLRQTMLKSIFSQGHTLNLTCSVQLMQEIFTLHAMDALARRVKDNGMKPASDKIHLREWRLFRGLTQENLAEAMGVEAATVSRIETGKISYTQPTLEAAARALLCQPSDILERDPKTNGVQLWDKIKNMSDEQVQDARRYLDFISQSDKSA